MFIPIDQSIVSSSGWNTPSFWITELLTLISAVSETNGKFSYFSSASASLAPLRLNVFVTVFSTLDL